MAEFTLGIAGLFGRAETASASSSSWAPRRRRPPSPLLVLVHGLALADVYQSLAFALAAAAPACFAQGLLVSAGGLSSSLLVAAHAYLALVRRSRPLLRTVCLVVAACWLFVYAMALLPVLATRNGAGRGGFFVYTDAWVSADDSHDDGAAHVHACIEEKDKSHSPRRGALESADPPGPCSQCWINEDYGRLRLATHHFFVFLALGLALTLYAAVLVTLRRRQRSEPLPPTHEPAILLYPLVHVVCNLPLALGRIDAMAGKHVPTGYLCFAGAVAASNGTLDSLLFATTRRGAVAAAPASPLSARGSGLMSFAFLKTPSTRRYGNMIWIQGGCGGAGAAEPGRGGAAAGPRWWPRSRLDASHRCRPAWPRPERAPPSSQDSLHAAAIHMDMVTSVVVEAGGQKSPWRSPRPPERMRAAASESVTSVDRASSKDS